MRTEWMIEIGLAVWGQVGDELLVREGKQQQQHAKEQSKAASSTYPGRIAVEDRWSG